MNKAQGSGFVASLASGTLGVLVRSDAVRAAVLESNGTKPIVSMLTRTDIALPGMILDHHTPNLGCLNQNLVPVDSRMPMTHCLAVSPMTHDMSLNP